MWASFQGNTDAIKELLQHNASVDLQGEDGWTALMYASDKGHTDAIKELLQHNASVDLHDKDVGTAFNYGSAASTHDEL